MSQTFASPGRRPSGRPTMRDVAALAGVAVKTVSRVMNNEPTVAPDLAARVHDAAAKLGYRPDLAASSLRRSDGRTGTIGLLLEDVANPFSASLLRAIEDRARSHGVHVLIGSVDEDAERERVLAQTLIDRRVDGLIVVPTGRDQSYFVAERRRGTHVVFLDREPRQYEADAVVSDHFGGAAAAVEHLLAAGHRRIAYLGDRTQISSAALRCAGYEAALLRAGFSVDAALVRQDLRTAEAAADVLAGMLDAADAPTAVFASQNLITFGAIRTLHRLGLAPTVALVGFDDFLLAEDIVPPVTVVTQDTLRLGHAAADRLFARLAGDGSPPTTTVVPTGLLVRGSGEIPPPSGRR